MKYRTLIKILLGILYLALTYGVLGPLLLSAKSGIAVALGIVVVIIIPAFIAVHFLNKFH